VASVWTWIASYAGRHVTDINGFVRLRLAQRNPQREAGLARMRQLVKAGKLKIAWMSEEEKAAYRLREPPETRATVGAVYDRDESEPDEVGLAQLGRSNPPIPVKFSR
jgi:hypothetical protein